MVRESATMLVDRAIERTCYRTPVVAVAGVRRVSELEAVKEKYGRSTHVTAVWVHRNRVARLADNTSPNLREHCDLELCMQTTADGSFRADPHMIQALLGKTEVVSDRYSLLKIKNT